MPSRSEAYSGSLLMLMSPAVVISVWEISSAQKWVNPILLPRPSEIFHALIVLIGSENIVAPLMHTISLVTIGFVLASIIGVTLGILMATSRIAYGILEPLVEMLRPIPKPALVPILFLFLGIGNATMVAVTVLAAVFPVLISTYQGVKAIDPVLIDTARTFRTRRLRSVISIVVPAALPMMLAGMRVALGLALVLAILAEMLAGEEGIGFRILDLQRSFQIRDMFAWLFVLVMLGAGLMIVFDIVERRLVPWRGKA